MELQEVDPTSCVLPPTFPLHILVYLCTAVHIQCYLKEQKDQHIIWREEHIWI